MTSNLQNLIDSIDFSPVIIQFDEMAKEMLQNGFTERECIERALEHSCDYVKVADYIHAILENTRTNKSAKAADVIRVLLEGLRKIEYVYDDGASELAKVFIDRAERIAGGEA